MWNKRKNICRLRFEFCCAGAVSIPGSAVANFRKRALILKPALALLSINIIPSLLALSSPSSTETCLFSDKSVLLPTNIMITSLPRSFLTSSIHLEVFKNDARSGQPWYHQWAKKMRGRTTYLWYHTQPLQLMSHEYRMVSMIEISLDQLCPITVNELFDLLSTWFLIRNQFQSLPAQNKMITRCC